MIFVSIPPGTTTKNNEETRFTCDCTRWQLYHVVKPCVRDSGSENPCSRRKNATSKRRKRLKKRNRRRPRGSSPLPVCRPCRLQNHQQRSPPRRRRQKNPPPLPPNNQRRHRVLLRPRHCPHVVRPDVLRLAQAPRRRPPPILRHPLSFLCRVGRCARNGGDSETRTTVVSSIRPSCS